MMNPPYPMSNQGSSYDMALGDARSRLASKIRIFEIARARKTATPYTGKSVLLSLPAELRTRVWQGVMQGDRRVIHVDLQDTWRDLELAPRLDLTFTCWQIREETRRMFLPNNTFLFKAKDYRINDGILENVADWLNRVSDENLSNIGRIVVCTRHSRGSLEYAWTQNGYMGMDSGFVVGDRIDPKVGDRYRNAHGLMVWDYGSWGHEDGHHCTKQHFEMVYPPAEAKKLEKELAKTAAEEKAYKGDGLSEERAYKGAETVEHD